MDIMMILLLLMMLPQLMSGIGGLFGANNNGANNQPIINIYTGVDEDGTGTAAEYTNTTGDTNNDNTGMFSSNPLGGDEDNPFDLALLGAGIGAAVGSIVPVLGTGIGAAVGGIGGFLVDMWWL
jgi:hypothetical protein